MNTDPDNPATQAMRRTQRVLLPVVAVLVAIIVVIVEHLPIALLPMMLVFSAIYIAGVTGGGRALASWYFRWRGERGE